MSNIIHFDSQKEFDNFIKMRTRGNAINSGTEGEIFLSKDGTMIYKKYYSISIFKGEVDKIITTSDLDLKYYMLPIEVYELDGVLIGCCSKYVSGIDLFEPKNFDMLYDSLESISEDRILKSYYEILEETNILSRERILIFDLFSNLMFIKGKFYAIDTCGYKRVLREPFIDNERDLNKVIKDSFAMFLDSFVLYDDKEMDSSRYDISMDVYVRKLKRIYKESKSLD